MVVSKNLDKLKSKDLELLRETTTSFIDNQMAEGMITAYKNKVE